MGFNLADVLKNVSESDTDREQIQYIPLSLIDGDENNFYNLTGVDDLAANIATVGLQQPIRVRINPNNPERYLTVSGHRRRAALDLLQADDPDKWGEAPCIVESAAVSPALQQLRLIYANANTRVLSPAEIGEQAAQVEKLLYQLKEEGYEFPGRMRDHVAEAVGASKSKLARLKVIREKLCPQWAELFKTNKIGESVAYALAGAPTPWQQIIYLEWKDNPNCLYASSLKTFLRRFEQIDAIVCSHTGGGCLHKQTMLSQSCKDPWRSDSCGCCLDCPNLRTCRSCCDKAVPKQKELRETEKAANAEAKQRAEERDAPALGYIREAYRRVGEARAAAGVSVKQLYAASAQHYRPSDDAKQEMLENHPEKITSTMTAIFGYSFRESDARILIRVADLLGVSIDWLLGHDRKAENVSDSGTWQTGTPPTGGVYAVVLMIKATAGTTVEEAEWDEDQWYIWGAPLDEDELVVTHWANFPKGHSDSLNQSCKTGMSPTGHCGAAAFCDANANCCLNCGEVCNSRCGWTEVPEPDDI